nr:zinc finger, CCHC-type [Tanacetum cinerariifolium]
MLYDGCGDLDTLAENLMTTSSANNSVFKGFFEKQKLSRPNFIDWYRQLRIVLPIEDKLNYLEQQIPSAPVALAGQQVAPEILAAHTAWIKGSKEIAGLMLMDLGKKINELHAMLKLHEKTLPKNNAHALHVIRVGKVQKVNKHKKPQPQMAARGQNHRKYLAKLLKKKKNRASGAGGSELYETLENRPNSSKKYGLDMSSIKHVKENPKVDKIGSKPNKNEKRGEAGKSQKQLQ